MKRPRQPLRLRLRGACFCRVEKRRFGRQSEERVCVVCGGHGPAWFACAQACLPACPPFFRDPTPAAEAAVLRAEQGVAWRFMARLVCSWLQIDIDSWVLVRRSHVDRKRLDLSIFIGKYVGSWSWCRDTTSPFFFRAKCLHRHLHLHLQLHLCRGGFPRPKPSSRIIGVKGLSVFSRVVSKH